MLFIPSIHPFVGLILAQLLKLNGASKVVIAANKGIKTQIARELEAGDEYIEFDRDDPASQWAQMKEDYKRGFDVVVRIPSNPLFSILRLCGVVT